MASRSIAIFARNCLAHKRIISHCSRVFLLSQFHKDSFYRSSSQSASEILKDSGILGKLKYKLRRMSKLRQVEHSALLLYEKCADTVDYISLIKLFELPDTFNSWFLLVQLHVWICLARLSSENHFRPMRNHITKAMWEDTEMRMKKLGNISIREKKEVLISMMEQLQAALIAYDEGLYGDDTVLAASIWRTLYIFNCKDPKLLETVVFYIRRQISHLDTQDTEFIMYSGKLAFLPLNSIMDEARTFKPS